MEILLTTSESVCSKPLDSGGGGGQAGPPGHVEEWLDPASCVHWIVWLNNAAIEAVNRDRNPPTALG
jgi:hypothetical protein